MFAKLVLLNGKLGVMHVVTGQCGITRPSSIFLSLGIVRDIVPLVIVRWAATLRAPSLQLFPFDIQDTQPSISTEKKY